MNKSSLEALLKKMMPVEQAGEVIAAVETIVAEQVTKLETEYNAKLEEAYEKVTRELEESEQTATAGYQQAHDMISDLQLRIETMQSEHQNHIDSVCEEAFQKLQEAEAKTKDVEATVYNEFSEKLKKVNEFYVDKLTAYLETHNAEIYEHARRDVLNDPRMVEHKVALDKIVETVSQYVTEEEFAGATTAKLEEIQNMNQKLREDLKVLETRNVRLSTQNTRLSEQVREKEAKLNEAVKLDRKESEKAVKNVSERGKRVLGDNEIVKEYSEPQESQRVADDDDVVLEGNDVLNDLLVVSGLKQSD